MIPGAQISTVYSPAVLVMSRVVNLLSFYSSTSSPLAQAILPPCLFLLFPEYY